MPRYSDREPHSVYQENSIPMNSKRRNSRLPWVIGALALLILLGCGGMAMLMSPYQPPEKVDQPIVTPATAPTPKAPSRPKAQAEKSISEGGYLVGTDLAPGTYRAPGAKRGSIIMCYWEVRPGGDPDGKISAQGLTGSVTEPGNVKLRKGDYFKTNGCEPWVKR